MALCRREPVTTLEGLRALLADSGGRQYYQELESLDVDQTLLARFVEKRCTSRIQAWLRLCANCGLCAESCGFYRATQNPLTVPAYKARVLGQIVRKKGAVSAAFLREAMDTAWGQCTCCNRCATRCPMGIDVGVMLSLLREALFEQGFIPWEMKIGSGMHRVYGAQMDVSDEEWRATCEWLEEEHGAAWPALHIPIEQRQAHTLYVLNAREAKHYPQDIAAAAMLFSLAGESWTVPATGWDSTSLSLFAGDREGSVQNVERVYAAVERLGPQRVVGTECGHAYRASVIEGPYWAGRKDGSTPVPFLHYIEWLAEALRSGRLRVDPAKRIQEPVTIQDSCNFVRNGGLGATLREVVHAFADDVREMPDYGDHALCCHGGGGLNGIGRYRTARDVAFASKVLQVRATGASLVIVACHNCWDAMHDMLGHYGMNDIRRSLLKPLLLECLELPEGFIADAYAGIKH